LGYGEMSLRETQRGTRLRRNLDNIVTAGERGRALVDRVLAFTTRAVAEPILVPVQDAMGEALDSIRAGLPAGIAIDEHFDAEQASVPGEPAQIRQILIELASNALQAMPDGGVLRVGLRKETLAAPRIASTGPIDAGEYVVLVVTDGGTGIAPDVIEHIFDAYFTTKETGIGTGLGLSLVQGIVSEAGGTINVTSEPGVGATFTVYLPRSEDISEAAADLPDDAPHGNGERILVVDDEEPLVNLVADNLRELGYAPDGFTSSLSALEAFRARPTHYQALITDERMPGLTGTALVQAIRELGVGIPVLLVSAFVGDDVSSRARAAGVDEVLRKPLARRDLAHALARVLRDRSAG